MLPKVLLVTFQHAVLVTQEAIDAGRADPIIGAISDAMIPSAAVTWFADALGGANRETG